MTNRGHKTCSHVICTQSAFTMSAMISSSMSIMEDFFGQHGKSMDTVTKIFYYSISTNVSSYLACSGWHFVFQQDVFCVFVTTLKWKNDVISLFPVLQGSAETLIRWGGKLCHLSTAWMLSMKHSCQKLLKDKTYTWVRLKNVGDLFMRHSVVIPLLQRLRGESSDKDVLITESKTLKQHRAYDSAVGSVILTDSKCKLKIILMSISRR